MQYKKNLSFNNTCSALCSPFRMGVYGGTFDPVHRGHIKLARAALQECALDKVLFLPAAQPPHKFEQTSYPHRLQMLQLALLGEKELQSNKFAIDTIEEELPHPSYTINTIDALLERYPGVSLFFIMGLDSLLDIKNWHGYQKILSTLHLIVSPRLGYGGNDDDVTMYMAELGYIPSQFGWQSNGAGKEIYLLDYTPPCISSSDIKIALHYGDAGLSVAKKMLYEEVVTYIIKHKLYL